MESGARAGALRTPDLQRIPATMKKLLPLACACLITFATIGWYKAEITTQTTASANKPIAKPALPPTDQQPSTDADSQATRLAIELLERYGNTIDQIATQANLYRDYRDILKNQKTLFFSGIVMAFPEQAETLRDLFEKLAHYDLWLEDEQITLRNLDALQRQAMLWQKREQLFGEQAGAIWSDDASGLNNEELWQEKLAQLDSDPTLTPEEAIHQIRTQVHSHYSNALAEQLVTPEVTAHTLLSLTTVQQQLSALSAAERHKRLNELRRQMGFTDQQIEQLHQRDQARDQRWAEGEAYMAERQAVSERLAGEQLDQALLELRQEYFGASAATIAREEADGFYRFKRDRRYGLN